MHTDYKLNHIAWVLGYNITDDLPKWDYALGRCDYDDKTIKLSDQLTGEFRTLVAVHELGHAMKWNRSSKETIDREREEHQSFQGPTFEAHIKTEIRAYLYGWMINKKLDIGISRASWKQGHDWLFTEIERNASNNL